MGVDPFRFAFQSLLRPDNTTDIFNYGKVDIWNQASEPKKHPPVVEKSPASASTEDNYELAANDFWKMINGENV